MSERVKFILQQLVSRGYSPKDEVTIKLAYAFAKVSDKKIHELFGIDPPAE